MMRFVRAPRIAVKKCTSLVLCVLICTPGIADAAPATDRYRIVAYVAGWSTPAVIHPEKLTHINFAFARITPAGQAALAEGTLEVSLGRPTARKKRNTAP